MKTGSGASASLAAMLSSLSSLACCLPFGLLAAAGLASAGAFFLRYRVWLMGSSVLFLALGFWQYSRARKCSSKPSVWSLVLLCVALAVVAAMILFPQQVAGFLADRFPGE